MPLDIAALAGTIVSSFLVPFAKQAGDAVREKVSERVGEKAAEQTTSLFDKVWKRVTSLFSSEPDSAMLDQLKRYPDQAAPLVQTVLLDRLKADAAAAKELAALVEQLADVGGGGHNIGQIIADTVGVVNAPGASVHAGGMIGGIVNVSRPDPIKPTHPAKS